MTFIVVFDDEMGACWPMCWDADCKGALVGLTSGPVALFDTRKAARQAIRVSTAYAKLRDAQGLSVNEDFLGGLSWVKVRACAPQAEQTQGGG